MKIMLYAIFYGGPDQLMPLSSALAAIFAFLLIFWNKVGGLFGKLLNFFRGSSKVSTTAVGDAPAKPEPAASDTPRSEAKE